MPNHFLSHRENRMKKQALSSLHSIKGIYIIWLLFTFTILAMTENKNSLTNAKGEFIRASKNSFYIIEFLVFYSSFKFS